MKNTNLFIPDVPYPKDGQTQLPADPPILEGSKLEFYLVTTDHLTDAIWFRDEQDFKVCMNYIAILSISSGIFVLAFILMSTHVHLVLQCSEAEAVWFIDELKRRYSEYLNRRYGVEDFLRRNRCDIRRVYIEDESLERAIAYTLMNSVAANICMNPSDYPWSSMKAYFQPTNPKGVRFGDMSMKSRRRILHSRATIPDHILICEDGYIAFQSYIPVKFVETLFRSPKRMNYYLANSSKAKRVLSLRETKIPTFKDQIILSAMSDICQSLFRKKSPDELTDEERTELIVQVRRRFSADISQIARVLGIPYPVIVEALESF